MKTSKLGKVKSTARGFGIIEFKDRYGEPCSLQVSSSVEPSVWLGCDNNAPKDPCTGKELSPRMHLSLGQVKALVAHLNRWVETGSFE